MNFKTITIKRGTILGNKDMAGMPLYWRIFVEPFTVTGIIKEGDVYTINGKCGCDHPFWQTSFPEFDASFDNGVLTLRAK